METVSVLDIPLSFGYKHGMATDQGLFYREFGKRLAAARQAMSFTQEALAKSVGLSRTSIVNIEKGRQPVHLHLVAKIVTSLNTNVSELLPDVQLLNADAAEVTRDLAKVSEHNRAWVRRIIGGSAFTKELDRATSIFPSQTQSNRTAQSSKRKSNARSR